MRKLSENEFLEFLAAALMYDEAPLIMDQQFPELVYDSTGKLMLAAALEQEMGVILSLDDLVACNTPGDVYELLNRIN